MGCCRTSRAATTTFRSRADRTFCDRGRSFRPDLGTGAAGRLEHGSLVDEHPRDALGEVPSRTPASVATYRVDTLDRSRARGPGITTSARPTGDPATGGRARSDRRQADSFDRRAHEAPSITPSSWAAPRSRDVWPNTPGRRQSRTSRRSHARGPGEHSSWRVISPRT